MATDVGSRFTLGDETFEVTQRLKEGGFGKTFLAVRTTPIGKTGLKKKTNVVIKVPADHVLSDATWLAKFSREARILGNVKHSNVVKVIAFWETITNTNEQALVQEYVEGATELPDYIKAHPDQAPSVLLQTLYALRAFHTYCQPSAVHRDLSPRNILVANDGTVKVIDFGLAMENPRATQVLTQQGESFGTPGCMSPEQLADAASVDHRTDLFAVGKTFAAAILQRHPQFVDLSTLPEPWQTICKRLAEYRPEDRPGSAEEAMSLAMALFAQHQIPIDPFDVHVFEFSRKPVIPGWAAVCSRDALTIQEVEQAQIRLMATLNPGVFVDPEFDANAIFDTLEGSKAIAEFAANTVSFEDADPLGTLFRGIYFGLDGPRRVACFERLCSVALRQHRYHVMGCVRHVYGLEPSPSVQAQLLAVINRLDTPVGATKLGVIWGRGIIPGRQ